MKLTVLSENAVLYPGLEGEFGLSVYLEEGDTRLLFDAGERDACLRNAEKLGIDLRRVTAVAFSHNHRSLRWFSAPGGAPSAGRTHLCP